MLESTTYQVNAAENHFFPLLRELVEPLRYVSPSIHEHVLADREREPAQRGVRQLHLVELAGVLGPQIAQEVVDVVDVLFVRLASNVEEALALGFDGEDFRGTSS